MDVLMDVLRKIKQIHVDVVLGIGSFIAGWFLLQYPIKVAFALVILAGLAFVGTLIVEDNEFEAREKKKND